MSKENVKEVSQVDEATEKEYDDLVSGRKSVVKIPGTKVTYKVGWMKSDTCRKISDIVLNEKDEWKRSAKVAAAVLVNSCWGFMLGWWSLKWRWMYYVRQWREDQLTPILEEGKKKVPQESYYLNTMLSIGMKDTLMTMTKAEVERTLQGLRGERASR